MCATSESALDSETNEWVCARCLFQFCHCWAGVVYFEFQIANCVRGGDESVVILVHLGAALSACEADSFSSTFLQKKCGMLIKDLPAAACLR